MRRQTEHEDVCAGAEDPVFGTGDNDRANRRMFKPDTLQRVLQLDIDAEIIRVQLQFVSWAQATVLLHVHSQRRHRAINGEPPMLILLRSGLVIDH